MPAWKAEVRVQGLQERRQLRSKRRIKTSVGQQRSKRSVFQGHCGRGACGRRRRERECKEEGVYAGGGMMCERELTCAHKCRISSTSRCFPQSFQNCSTNSSTDGPKQATTSAQQRSCFLRATAASSRWVYDACTRSSTPHAGAIAARPRHELLIGEEQLVRGRQMKLGVCG